MCPRYIFFLYIIESTLWWSYTNIGYTSWSRNSSKRGKKGTCGNHFCMHKSFHISSTYTVFHSCCTTFLSNPKMITYLNLDSWYFRSVNCIFMSCDMTVMYQVITSFLLLVRSMSKCCSCSCHFHANTFLLWRENLSFKDFFMGCFANKTKRLLC